MMRRSLGTQPNLDEPPPGPTPGPPTRDGWPPGSRPPAFRTPVLTYALIGVNVALWLVTALVGPGDWLHQLVSPDMSTLMLLGAKVGPAIRGGEYWRLVTAMFLHYGIIHLAVNMWALLQLGTVCEVLYGRARFLILYVCSGVMGTFASYKLSENLGVGASGAIFGLFGVAIVYSIKYRRELPRGMGDRMLRSLMPALLLNLVITFTIPLIDKFAHLGGLITGGLLAVLTESQIASAERRERESLPVPLALLTVVGLLGYGVWGLGTTLPRARRLYAATVATHRGDLSGAIRSLRKVTARYPDDIGASEWLLLLLREQRRWPEATQEFIAFSRTSAPPGEIVQVGGGLAQELANARQGNEAEAVYRRLLELDPDDFELLNGLAYLYADVLETHLDQAEQMARKALQKPPASRGIVYRFVWNLARGGIVDTLAWVYFKEGKLKAAYATQQRAIRLVGNHADARCHMGAIDEARGDLAAARQEYERALRLDPRQAEARRALEKLRRGPPALPPAPPRAGTKVTAG